MTEIDLSNGVLFLNGEIFRPKIENETPNFHTIQNNSYSNFSINAEINHIPFIATGYYKNKSLTSITLLIKPDYFKEKYSKEQNADFRDDLNQYIDYSKMLTEELINELVKSKKRKFNWGKIQIQVDPRDPTVYGEIKYYHTKDSYL